MPEGLFVKKPMSNTGGHSFNSLSNHLSTLGKNFSIPIRLKIFDLSFPSVRQKPTRALANQSAHTSACANQDATFQLRQSGRVSCRHA